MTQQLDEQPRSLWRDTRFRSFWAGDAISQFGDRISELALPLIAVTSLDATANEVALLTALVWMPNLLAIGLGAWVDHQPRKRALMVITDLVRAVVLLSLPIAFLLGHVSLGQLYLVAVVSGIAAVVFNTADTSFFAHLVPRSSYLDANSKLSATRSASFVAGPAVGGVLVQVLSAPVAVLADAASFIASAFLVGRIKIDNPAMSREDDADVLWRRARAGLRLVLHDKVLRASLLCSTTMNFFTFVSAGLIVLFASRNLELSSGVIGLTFGIGSTGALLGAVVAPRLSTVIGLGRSIAIGAVLFPAPIALAAIAAGPLWVRAGALALAQFIAGFGVMLFDVNQNSLKAATIPDGMRSRVSGAYSTINYGVRPLGAVAGGLLATAFGVRPTLLVAAVGGAASVFWLLGSPIPKVRSLASYEPATSQVTDDVLLMT